MNIPLITKIFAVLTVLYGCGGGGSSSDSAPASGPVLAPSAVTINCTDQALIINGAYRAENNTWGKGTLNGWSQCIGLGTGTGGALVGRWTWNWLDSGGNVKAYPEVIFGQKPGNPSTSSALPKKISDIGVATVAYDVSSTHTGSGNVAFDIWLTNIQNPSTFAVPPITHEIMIWLEDYGGMQLGGTLLEQVTIDGSVYDVFVGESFGAGWRYIAFRRAPSPLAVGSLNLVAFLSYIRTKNLATGDEYLASVEFGNEVISGVGETLLNAYAVSVQ